MRTCTVCNHPKASEINEALLGGEAYRSIAKRFSASASAVYRHQQDHLPAHLVKAKAAAEVLDADRLIRHLESLREETLGVLAEAKKSGEWGMMLKAVARAEMQLRLAAELLGQLRTKVDVTEVRVIRSLEDLSNDELQLFIDDAKAVEEKHRAKAALLSINAPVQ